MAPPLYSDTRALGAPFFVAIVLGTCAVLGLTLGWTALVTFIVQGVHPIAQICECPSNYPDFPGAIFFDDCGDPESSWYQTYNAVPANATHEVSGWFSKTEWSRATLRSHDLNKAVTIEAEVLTDLITILKFHAIQGGCACS